MSQRRRLGMSVAVAALVIGTGTGLAAPGAGAVPGAPMDTTPAAFSGGTQEIATQAMVDQLGISRSEAVRRLEAQPAQVSLANKLEASLGSRAAGTWIDQASGELVVNVLDSAAADDVRAAGATPRVVERSPAQLAAVESSLSPAPGTSVGVDITTNQVVVSVPESMDAATKAYVAQARSLGDAVRIETVAGKFMPQHLLGGDQINGPGFICSAGFIGNDGGGQIVVTAGHCTAGDPTFTREGSVIGDTIESHFPNPGQAGDDFGSVRINNPGFWPTFGFIHDFGGFQQITGTGQVPVGAQVCKSGRTTGTTCGQVLAYNQDVTFGSGETVTNMAITTACTQPGDSGGGVYAGSAAQAIVSGGTVGPCGGGSRSIFQPIGEALGGLGAGLL